MSGPAPGLASALDRLGTETAFSVLARAKALERSGRDIVHLEIGEPDFDTAPHIVDAAVAAMRDGMTHYCPSAGLDELRESIAGYFSRTRGVGFEARNCLVANGAKPFLFFTVLACCNPGDEVIYPDPGFPIYESAIRFAGAVPVPLELREEESFSLNPERLAALLSPRTKLVILNYPQNPTGGTLGPAAVEAVAAVLETSQAWILADEIYSQLQYDEPFSSITRFGSLLERTVVLDGLSKTYAMTGWRCGFAAVPEGLVEPLVRFFVNSTSCVPPFVQLAGVAALEGPQDAVAEMVGEFVRRRRIVVDGLNELPGVRCIEPAGAFYAFPNVEGVPLPADVLAQRLLDEAGVATLAGSAFGRFADDYLRISYANSETNLREALSRMASFLDAL
ncbi:MAG: pyridoxal phosphate-dependent aminotransferase [Gaiellaceae bacterium]